jgi:hypothetical protein
MTRQVILIESPYAGNPDALRYLSCCLLDSILRGEAPIASHALYPLALPEHVDAYDGKTGREIGLECRDALADVANGCVCYTDLGESKSGAMRRVGFYLADRTLQGEAKAIWERGEWPTMARLTHNHVVSK